MSYIIIIIIITIIIIIIISEPSIVKDFLTAATSLHVYMLFSS